MKHKMKSKLLLLFFLLFVGYFRAQFPINIGTTNIDWFGECTITQDNNLLIAGTNNYAGDWSSGDVTLRKVDFNGNLIWDKVFGAGGAEDVASGIIPTTDGGYVIFGGHTKTYAGSFYTGGVDQFSATYIIKTDANGNQLWAKSLGGASYGDNYGVTVVENSLGEFICYGHVQNHSGCSSYATRILKLSAAGNIIWSNCLQLNPDVVGGFTRIQGENNYVGCHNLSGSVALRKYNDNGVVISQSNYQYQGNATTSSKLISNSTGEFYLLGISNNKATVAKFDNSLNLIWDTTFLTPLNSRFIDLKSYGADLILTGDIEVVDVTNEYDFWLVKIATNGQFLSQYTNPTPGIDVSARGSAIYQDDIFISGQINSAGADQYSVKVNLSQSLCSSSSSQISISSCNDYTAPDFQTYTFSGIYTAVIPNSTGCDSTITIDLTIVPPAFPTFTQVGPYTNGATIPALPTISTNNISGTWSPTINNTATTAYTFTPNAGQCASTTTMTIAINNPLSYFISATDTSICAGTVVTLSVNIEPTNTATDIDGNTYETVQIGSQIWMKENLRTTKYANGDVIPNVTDGNQWSNLTTGAWSCYSNDNQYQNIYGNLYNWFAVADQRNICPTGWHVPSDVEWTTLIDYLGDLSVTGGKMKSTDTYWQSPNQDATNQSGFSGLPGGLRDYDGTFIYIGYNGYWWDSSEAFTNLVWYHLLTYLHGAVNYNYYYKESGLSVRCLKN
jgi:uncharacterized protein (TIGR02145 family)